MQMAASTGCGEPEVGHVADDQVAGEPLVGQPLAQELDVARARGRGPVMR